MDDTIFRTQIESVPQEASTPVEIKENEPSPAAPKSESIEVPYTSFEGANSKPFCVDYFELGDTWNSADGGFSKEVAIIEEYFTKKVNKGEIENSTSVIKEKLKEIEKMANTHGDGRKSIRLGTISAYLEYLMKVDKVMYNVKRYK